MAREPLGKHRSNFSVISPVNLLVLTKAVTDASGRNCMLETDFSLNCDAPQQTVDVSCVTGHGTFWSESCLIRF